MLSKTTYCFPKNITEGLIVPISSLDHVLYKGKKPDVTYYCPISGNIFTNDSIKLLCEQVKEKKYTGTDHTPFSFIVDSVKIAYVSLDNSVKSNSQGFGLVKSDRLRQICEIVKKIDADLVFFFRSGS